MTDPIRDSFFSCDIAFGKPRAGQLPVFNQISQIQPFSISASLDSEKIIIQGQSTSILFALSSVSLIWGLNSNPLIKMVLSPPLTSFNAFADFPGFTKNSIMGVRFRKEQISGQATPWIYGFTQYPTPLFDTQEKTIHVSGYGVLAEAARRQNSRNFKTTEGKEIVSTIAKRYGLIFKTRGPVPNIVLAEPEQNVDDMTFLNIVSSKLDSFWVIEENALVLINAGYMFNQIPKLNLFFGSLNKTDDSNAFPIMEFVPEETARSFEAGAGRFIARGVDLDTGEVVQKIFTPQRTRLGSLSLSSSQFRSDKGVTINSEILKPCPEFSSTLESEVFLPWHTRSDENLTYQFNVEKKDLSVRASIEMMGMPVLKPGMMVNVQGVGELLGGNYIIESIEHHLEKSKGFTSILRLMRNGLCQISSASPFKTNLNKAPNNAFSGGVNTFVEKLSET